MHQEYQLNTAKGSKAKARVLIIYTGGTLGMVSDPKTKSLIPFPFGSLQNYIPEILHLGIDLSVISFERPIDSSNINPSSWSMMGEIINHRMSDFDGFVILHGTDTMAYSASALSFMFENLQKPIIFTGAQLPIGVARSDARNNLISALEVSALKSGGQSVVREVCIYFDYLLLRGNRAKKIESEHFDAFHSENFPNLAEAGIEIDLHDINFLKNDSEAELIFRNKFSDAVFLLKIFPGINASVISELLNKTSIKGLVLETFGSGNAPTDSSFNQLIESLTNRGVLIYNVSQCMGGRVKQGLYETSQVMMEMGVISGRDITTEAAVVKMMYLLGNYSNTTEISELLKRPIRGEMADFD